MKKRFILILKFFVSGILLALIFNKIPITNILMSLDSANIILIAFSFIIFLLYQYLSAFETSYLLTIQKMFLSTIEIFKIHLISMYYNLLLPGMVAGGIVKWHKYSKYGNKTDAVSVIVYNRYLEILMLLFTGIFYSWPSFVKRGQSDFLTIWLIVLAIVFSLLFVLLNKSTFNLLKRIIPFFRISDKISVIINKFLISMEKFQNFSLRRNFQIFGLLFLYHSLGIVTFFLLALSLNINISFSDIAWIRSAISIATLLPISIAGLGVREGLLIFILSSYKIPNSESMAYSCLLFFISLLTSLCGGLLEFYSSINDAKILLNKTNTQS